MAFSYRNSLQFSLLFAKFGNFHAIKENKYPKIKQSNCKFIQKTLKKLSVTNNY